MADSNSKNRGMDMLGEMLKNMPKARSSKIFPDKQQSGGGAYPTTFRSGAAGAAAGSGALQFSADVRADNGGTVQMSCSYPAGTRMAALPGYETTGDFSFSKADAKGSDEQYAQAIRNLAAKHAADGNYQGSRDIREWKKLQESYVSVVSPDRRGIIGAAAGTPAPNIGAELARAYDESGKHIASYSGANGWKNVVTADEKARIKMFYDIYNSAYKGGKKGGGPGNPLSVSA